MNSLNKAILIGRLGKDPEVRYFEGGNVKASFPIATSEIYKDKSGQRVENTQWHNIVCWSKLAEIAEKFLKKGSFVYVEGKIISRSWDDKEGNKRYTTEIIADNFLMLDKKSETPSGQVSESASVAASEPVSPGASLAGNTNVTDESENDLPF